MNETEKLVNDIVKGIQDKKGHKISVADLNGIGDTICKYLVICEGNSPTQVSAIADSVEESARVNSGIKPIGTEGERNCIWVVMDYADVIVHVFLPEAREFYDLDNLWEDAKITSYEDI